MLNAIGAESVSRNVGRNRVMKKVSIAATGLVLIGCLAWRFESGVVFSDAVLSRLKPGMTTNEVIAVLGAPSWASRYQWHYTRPFMSNAGIVFFDESDRFRTAIND